MPHLAHFGGAMIFSRLAIFFVFLLSSSTSGERWSRQLTGEGVDGEWIPLQADGRQPKAQARVLVDQQFQNTFFPQEPFQDYLAQGGARQLYIQSPNSVSQQSFVPRSQNQPIRLTLTGQFNALPQSFAFPRSPTPTYNDFRQSIQAQFQQPHLVVPPAQLNNQFFNQPPPQKGLVLAPLNPIAQPPPKSEVKLVNTTIDRGEALKTNLPTLKEKLSKEYSDASITNSKDKFAAITPSSTAVENEEVQLLYVPLETLQNKKFDLKQFLKNPPKQISLHDSIGSPGQINNQLYPQTTPAYMRPPTQINNIRQDLYQQQVNAHRLQESLPRDFVNPSSITPSPFSQATHPVPVLSTPKSKKLKAHQPPLAIYMIHGEKEKARLGDVLSILKESTTVSVLDNIPPNAPKVFIGPNNLKLPSNVAKFELPYLSNIDGNRIPRRIESLPFFVAPLSYKAPNGFAKIPFPAPHVGSVIVNPFMKDADESPTTITIGSPSTFSSFPQSTTEGFRSTIKESAPTKPTIFNYFPSTTSSQTSFPSSKPSVTITSQQPSIYSTKNPESNSANSYKGPSTFFPTSVRPTVSFFGFSEPTFNTLPTTTHKPSTVISFDNRGHYITNAAVPVESSRPPHKQGSTYKENISERPNTSPIPQPHVSRNPFNFINPFVLRNPYEPQEFIQNVRGNDVRHYNVVERPAVQNFNQFAQQQPKYPQYQVSQQKPEIPKVNFGQENLFSSPVYPTEPSPSAGPTIKTTLVPVEQEQYDVFESNKNNQDQYNAVRNPTQDQYNAVRNPPQDQYNAYGNREVLGGFIPSYNQYPSHSVESDITHVTQQNDYQETETPAYEETTTTTTTTSTTTTPAPTTTRPYGRRPINRGRPRYTTTLRPDGDETTTVRATTRRTPLRERRPTTYRSRVTTTTESSANAETTTRRSRDYSKSSTRVSNRQRVQEEDGTTTESSADKSRNQRFRSRGRVHFKTSDNYEGPDFVSKKKKEKGEPDDLAYQRDVLHQNYPVTLSERLSTLEVRTTPSSPSSTPSNINNIRIYETTGSTQKPISSTYETHTSEQPYYENEAVFQQEPEKFLTHPDEYVEINGKYSGRTTSAQHSSVTGRQEQVVSSTTAQYEEPRVHTVTEEQFESKVIDKNNQPPKTDKYEEEEKPIESFPYGGLPIKYAPDVPLTEEPVPKFRTKLKNRSKLFQSTSAPRYQEDDNQNVSSDTFVTSTRRLEETTTEGYEFARKSSPSSVTHRPTFSSRRTTMRIEDIEEELKTKRTQLKLDSRPRANKYPVYKPESSSTTSAPVNEENDITTTKRTKVIRRKPIVRTTTSSSVESSTTEATANERPVNTKVRRVRVRTRVRKPTTEKIDVADNEAITEEKYTTTSRSPTQKYSTKNRQRYFKRPTVEKEAENGDDQAYFDSINRPEVIKFNPETGNHEYVEYNIENGRDETQWSPKINPGAFRPILNPNFIGYGKKPSESDNYGSKASFSATEEKEPEIITVKNNQEDDILLTVTPRTNNLNSKPETRRQKEYIAEKPSTFETVLEEVMRNLEEQDESDYMTVVKHEGGEIGEIPPDSTVLSDAQISTTESSKLQTTTVTLPTTMAQERFHSTALGSQASSTERQGRRRGVWRKVNVRPIQKEVFESAESQFYKNSKNELNKEPRKQNKYEKAQVIKANADFEAVNKVATTLANLVLPTTQETITTIQAKEEQTDYPDLIAMEVSEDDVTFPPKTIKDEQAFTEMITEYLMSGTDKPVQLEAAEITTVEQQTTEEPVKDVKVDQTETLVEKIEENFTTTSQPESKETNEVTVKIEEEKPKSFLEVMEELLGSNDEQQITKSVESEEQDKKVESNKNSKENELETTTAGFKFFDPKSIISTSVSTQVSHETEICFRGKCIKTKKTDDKK